MGRGKLTLPLKLKDGWKKLPLIEVATLQRGFDLPVQDRISGKIPIFAANGPVGTHNAAKCLGPGVITGRSGTIGKVHYVEQDYWPLNTSLFVKNFHGNHPRFIYYLLSWMKLEQFHEGTGVPTLNRNNVHEVDVFVPPIEEQKRIAAVLDQAEELRSQRRKAIGLLDELVRSVFLEMFGDLALNPKHWDKCSLTHLCASSDDIKCGPFGTQLGREEYQDEGIPLWGIKHVNANFKIPTFEFVSKKKAKELEVYVLQPQDLVMTRKGTVGNCAIFPRDVEPGIMHSDLLRVRVSPKKSDSIFLCHQLQYSRDVEHQISLISGGAIMAGINVTKLKSIMVVSPPLPLQQEFAQRVAAIETLKANHRQSLAKLDQLFASLQHRAFRGEL